MYIKSPYPDPPQLSEANAYHMLFERPDQSAWPTNFTAHIDAETGETLMHRDLISRIEALSTGLASPLSQGGLEVGSTELIGVIGENSSEYITLFHACIRIATRTVHISPHSTPFELNHTLTVSKPSRLFIDEKLLDRLLPVCSKAGIADDKIYILKSRQIENRINKRQSCSSVINNAKNFKTVAVGIVAKDDVAYFVFSSGTTGLPKAITISHWNVTYTVGQFFVLGKVAAAAAPRRSGIPIALTCVPLYHVYGLMSYCFSPCLTPYTLVILPRWDPNLALKSIAKYNVTGLSLVPSFVHQIVNHPDVEKVDLSSVTNVNCGASYLSSDLFAKMKKLLPENTRFLQGYGMSEATVAAIIQPGDGYLGGKLKLVPGSTGVLCPGMEARIVREDGTEADFNQLGELWLRSGNISPGYWKNEKANKETFQDGWLRTGDYFRVDENGYFWYGDRVKDTLKVSGSQVSPKEIENCLLDQPDKLIIDVAVAGVSGGLTSDEKVPRAWIVLSPSGKKLGNEKVMQILDSWHKENLSRYKHLKGGIEVVSEIPKTPTGKILRKVLQDKYEAKNTKSKL